MTAPKNPAAVSLGTLGGKATSAAKTSAAQANGRKGGRPPASLRFSLQLDLDNAAFTDNPGEVSRILREVAAYLDTHGVLGRHDSFPLLDVNGNTVGSFTVKGGR